jgi:hypothetical protein
MTAAILTETKVNSVQVNHRVQSLAEWLLQEE